jgi:hypothetical protein
VASSGRDFRLQIGDFRLQIDRERSLLHPRGLIGWMRPRRTALFRL